MSVPTSGQAFAFLTPLRRRASVFISPTRTRNLEVVRFVLGCLAVSRTPRTLMFDTSSLYGQNAQELAGSLPKDFLQRSVLILPGEHRRIEDSMADILETKADAILIDDLNSLHYLLSSGTLRSGARALFSFLRILSYDARINNTSVIGTVYRPERDFAVDRGTKRSLLAAADLQIRTDVERGRMTFRCNEIRSWPNDRFSAPSHFWESTYIPM
jgi:hypothetical protein